MNFFLLDDVVKKFLMKVGQLSQCTAQGFNDPSRKTMDLNCSAAENYDLAKCRANIESPNQHCINVCESEMSVSYLPYVTNQSLSRKNKSRESKRIGRNYSIRPK